MKRIRVIPVLTIIGNRLVKTVRFKHPNYIGDPINSIKIFNEKEVDEIALIDIRSSLLNTEPNYKLIQSMASESFMPMSYGGGIQSFEQAKKIFDLGIEKIILNTAALEKPELIRQISDHYGAQSVVISVDYATNFFGKRRILVRSGSQKSSADITDYLLQIQELGAGEILLTNVDREGTFLGYDVDFYKSITHKMSIPVVANGGLNSIETMQQAVVNGGVSAVAGSSFFIYKNNNTESILINYPTQKILKEQLYDAVY